MIEPLTSREVQVMYFLYHFELEYGDIAHMVGLKKCTVQNHVASIFGKLGVRKRPLAVHLYSSIDPIYRQSYIDYVNQYHPNPQK